MSNTCIFDGCTSVVNARGWCSTHYGRWLKTGSPERVCLGCRRAVRDGRTRWCGEACKPRCKFDDCKKSAYARNGLCSGHDRQLRETGELRPFKFERPASGGKCAVCDSQIPAGRRRTTCSVACRQRLHHHGGKRKKCIECRGCGTSVSVTDRRPDGKLRRSDTKWCSSCLDDSVRRRMYRYGVSPEQYESAMATGCEICGSKTDLHVDHDHDCCPGEYTCGSCVRGFLCGSCNRGLGIFSNDADRLMAAAGYVLKTRDVVALAAVNFGGASFRS